MKRAESQAGHRNWSPLRDHASISPPRVRWKITGARVAPPCWAEEIEFVGGSIHPNRAISSFFQIFSDSTSGFVLALQLPLGSIGSRSCRSGTGARTEEVCAAIETNSACFSRIERGTLDLCSSERPCALHSTWQVRTARKGGPQSWRSDALSIVRIG